MMAWNNYAEEEKMNKGVIKEQSVNLREQRERGREWVCVCVCERERERERVCV